MEIKKARPQSLPVEEADAGEARVLEALRKGYHSRDPALLASLYADNAEMHILNRNNPPSKTLVLRGRDAIRQMLDDICSREMTHRIDDMTAGAGAIAFSVHCRYPDGCQVVGLNRATIEHGRIVRELNISCWDE